MCISGCLIGRHTWTLQIRNRCGWCKIAACPSRSRRPACRTNTPAGLAVHEGGLFTCAPPVEGGAVQTPRSSDVTHVCESLRVLAPHGLLLVIDTHGLWCWRINLLYRRRQGEKWCNYKNSHSLLVCILVADACSPIVSARVALDACCTGLHNVQGVLFVFGAVAEAVQNSMHVLLVG